MGTSDDFGVTRGLLGISGTMEGLSGKKEYLGMRKTFVLVTVAVLIVLLACSGPALTPDTEGTRPPAKSEAMPGDTTSGASGRVPTETPNHIDAATAPPPIYPSPKVTVGSTGAPTAPTTAPISVAEPQNSGVTAAPTPRQSRLRRSPPRRLRPRPRHRYPRQRRPL